MENTNAIELRGICKRFGRKIASDHVNLDVRHGEILSLLGENGSGKTALMNAIAGIYYPDEGEIYVDGEQVNITSPKDAFKYHIGMVHQHFKLVNVFSGIDNIILGEKANPFSVLKKKRGSDIKAIAERYGFDIDLNKKIYDMSVSEKQSVEIIKTLYRGADILILDEPTAVLTPQETTKLFAILKKMKEDGKSVIIITHKLNEVMEISDRVAVLNKGKHIGTVVTEETSEKQLTEMMVGHKIDLEIERDEPVHPENRIFVDRLNVVNQEGRVVVSDVSFTARSGEILGIAGIAGSGQKELLEAIAGLQRIKSGSIMYKDKDEKGYELSRMNPSKIRDLGIHLSFVPEDRLGMGLVGNMDLVDNVTLRYYQKGKSPFVQSKEPTRLTIKIVDDLSVDTPSIKTQISKLSGGNVQKILLGREIASSPTVLMTAYPVRGLDINSSYLIYNLLNEEKKKGTAVIYVGEDLDVLLALADRILVICDGQLSGIVDARTTTKEEVGLLMTKVGGKA